MSSIYSYNHVNLQMDTEIFGGCEGDKLTMGVAAIMVLAAILIIWYVYTFLKDSGKIGATEKMCGGYDQLCPCSGNETMTNNKEVRPVSDSDLTRLAAGF